MKTYAGVWAVILVLAGWSPDPAAAESAPPAPEPSAASATNIDPEVEVLEQARQKLLLGQHLETLGLLRGIIKRQPDHRQARFMIATTLVEMGKTREALTVFRQLQARYPEDVGVLNNMAWVLATDADPEVRNPTQALALARQALMIAPITYNIWSTLSESYYQVGDYVRALRAAEEAVSLGQLQKAPEETVAKYREQENKCRDAVRVFSLIE